MRAGAHCGAVECTTVSGVTTLPIAKALDEIAIVAVFLYM
jgi:hypothetical protein